MAGRPPHGQQRPRRSPPAITLRRRNRGSGPRKLELLGSRRPGETLSRVHACDARVRWRLPGGGSRRDFRARVSDLWPVRHPPCGLTGRREGARRRSVPLSRCLRRGSEPVGSVPRSRSTLQSRRAGLAPQRCMKRTFWALDSVRWVGGSEHSFTVGWCRAGGDRWRRCRDRLARAAACRRTGRFARPRCRRRRGSDVRRRCVGQPFDWGRPCRLQHTSSGALRMVPEGVLRLRRQAALPVC